MRTLRANTRVLTTWFKSSKIEHLTERETAIARKSRSATERYGGTLLYLPVPWIVRHAKYIDNPEPRGTGEDDYAFLLITEIADGGSFFPTVFPFVTPKTSQLRIKKDDFVLLSGYPTKTTTVEDVAVLETINIVSTFAIIGELFTFDSDTLDLFSLVKPTQEGLESAKNIGSRLRPEPLFDR